MNSEPSMGKNYWLALALSFVVLMGYPYFMKLISPPPPPHEAITPQEGQEIPDEITAFSEEPPQVEQEAALTQAEGPFIETPSAAKPAFVLYENMNFEAEFSTLGASISRLFYKGEPKKRELTQSLFFSGEPDEPGLLALKFLHEDVDLSRANFRLTRKGSQNEIFEFSYEKPQDYRIVKKYVFEEGIPVVYLDLTIENLSGREKHFPIELQYGMDVGVVKGVDARFVEAVGRMEKVKTANIGKIRKKGAVFAKPMEWAGLMKKYFAILVMPDWKAISQSVTAPREDRMWTALRMDPISIASGASETHRFMVYAGSQRYDMLKELGFEDLLSRGFFGLFKVWILNSLRFFNKYTHNYGWAIILVTLIIKLIFTPLTHMSFESMKKMQVIQPKLKALQERHKKDPTKLNKEMMELYKRNKVNPMMGCLPMLLQIPIFIAFYQGLAEAIELRGAPFIFWIQDLSEPDRLFSLPFTIPILGDGINLLPILMIGSMVWQQKLTPTAAASPEQAKMMNLMPLIFGFLFYGMPSGLVLYWFINNVLSIVHQVFVKRIVVVLHHEDQE